MTRGWRNELVDWLRGLNGGGDDDALSDRRLLSGFVGGRDESAFAALMQRHGRMVLAVCRRVLRDGQDAEDAFQATFLVLSRRAGSIGNPEALAG